MTSYLASLAVLSFFFLPNGDMFGTTTTGVPFSQVTIMQEPRVMEFTIESEHWYVCEAGAFPDLSGLSVCVAQ